MEDRLFHAIEIFVQMIGLGLLVFKGGKYIGDANGMFKTLFNGQEELKKAQNSHEEEDDKKHEKIMDAISDVRVKLAGMAGQDKHS